MSIAMTDGPRRHRITVDEYYRIAESSYAPDARLELIEGEIVEMPPIGALHAGTVDQLVSLLIHAVGERATVRCQGPLLLDTFSEPQPDLLLLAPREDFYKYQRPTAADTLLAIEVSQTTLRYDRNRKMPLYARHGIPEMWIVDTEGRQLHVFRALANGAYGEVLCLDRPGVTSIGALPGMTIDPAALF